MTYSADKVHIETHQKHIEAGFCPSVNISKAWCNERAGHSGEHRAPYFFPGYRVESVYWKGSSSCPCSKVEAGT